LNEKLESFKKFIKDKKVAVLGIGISNTPLIKYLASLSVDITAFDRSDEKKLASTLKEFEDLDIKYSLGENYLSALKNFDVIFKTPKIRFDIPELLAEKERGALITSEMEVFCDICPARIFAVTGSDGKTTTSTLINLILKEQGYKCWLGGNIGTPLLDRIDEINGNDMVVLELSSFQLHTMKNRIHTAVVTNLSPNHLDVHLSMEEYTDAKKNIFRYQHPEDLLVLNLENEITRNFAGEARGKVAFFSSSRSLDNEMEGVFAENGHIIVRKSGINKTVLDVDDIVLPGLHNLENYLAAIAAVESFVDPDSIKKVARTFRGVEHRIEFVANINGISFYNDSIGTSPARTRASVLAFNKPVILIAGGYDKKIPYDEMGSLIVERVKSLVLIGETAPLIEKALKDAVARTGKGKDIKVIKCDSLEKAVEAAYNIAVENDIILLSPASASFDMFKNFEERGRKFKEAVHNLV